MVIENNEVKEGKKLAWLSYWGVLFLVPLLVGKDNRFTKFHSKQGMVLFFYYLAWAVLYMVGSIAFLLIVGLLPHNRPIRPFSFPTFALAVFVILGGIIAVLDFVGFIQSLRGKYWKCPLGVYKLSEKFKI